MVCEKCTSTVRKLVHQEVRRIPRERAEIKVLLIYVPEVAVINLLFTFAALFAAQPIADRDAEKWHQEPNPTQDHPFFAAGV